MIHPDTELRFISPEKGFGVVATKLIPKGTITWIGDALDMVISPEQYAKSAPIMKEVLYKYCFINNHGHYILCWDISRYVNHSFKSNCISTAYNFELAVRDILPGEELTDDYGYLNPQEPIVFPPEEGSIRTMVLPDDILHYHKYWDSQLEGAFVHFNTVNQPLKGFIEDQYVEKVKKVAEGSARMDSILNCYYNPLKQPQE